LFVLIVELHASALQILHQFQESNNFLVTNHSLQARPLHNDRPKSWNILPLSVSAMDTLHLSFSLTNTAENVTKSAGAFFNTITA
jgi:hypothetical protein